MLRNLEEVLDHESVCPHRVGGADRSLPPAACSPGSDLPMLAAKPDVSSYHLGPGDRLEIKVLGADELTGQYSVKDDGTIRMLMVGEITAAGFTPEQVQTKIEDKLKAGRFITQPHASVAVLTYRPLYIVGEVASPGGYSHVSGMKVLSAVAAAHGYTYYRANQELCNSHAKWRGQQGGYYIVGSARRYHSRPGALL